MTSPVEVGESDRPGEALIHQLLHGIPGVDVVGLHVGHEVTLVVDWHHRSLEQRRPNLLTTVGIITVSVWPMDQITIKTPNPK
jgi:hypothetical protein